MPGRVRLERLDGGIAVVTLDRPERRNAMDAEMWRALGESVRAAADARVVIVRGAGGHFSAGMDLKPDNPVVAEAEPAIAGGDEEAARALLRRLKGILAELRRCPAPTVAAIEGVAVGGGLEIALHCDVRIAARDARLGLPEVRVGMIPDLGGTVLAARLLGPGRAAWLACSGREVDGETAFRLGLVDELAEPRGALEAALAWARDVALGGPRAVAHVVETVRRVAHAGLDEDLALETVAGARALTSGEPVEGIAAFVEKRLPRWDGA